VIYERKADRVGASAARQFSGVVARGQRVVNPRWGGLVARDLFEFSMIG
jgi:hypothetical protein